MGYYVTKKATSKQNTLFKLTGSVITCFIYLNKVGLNIITLSLPDKTKFKAVIRKQENEVQRPTIFYKC